MGTLETRKITVRVNGEKKELDREMNLLDLLKEFAIRRDSVVLELNRRIVGRTRFETTYLTDGDSLEIVHFIGGGQR